MVVSSKKNSRLILCQKVIYDTMSNCCAIKGCSSSTEFIENADWILNVVKIIRFNECLINSLTWVAYFNTKAVSANSTKNVDWPDNILSEAPTRVNIRSTAVSVHESAGTLHPICAKMVMRQVCLSRVDLPPY